jgi:hypothetical protein
MVEKKKHDLQDGSRIHELVFEDISYYAISSCVERVCYVQFNLNILTRSK